MIGDRQFIKKYFHEVTFKMYIHAFIILLVILISNHVFVLDVHTLLFEFLVLMTISLIDISINIRRRFVKYYRYFIYNFRSRSPSVLRYVLNPMCIVFIIISIIAIVLLTPAAIRSIINPIESKYAYISAVKLLIGTIAGFYFLLIFCLFLYCEIVAIYRHIRIERIQPHK